MLSAAEIIRRYQVIIGHLGNGGEKKSCLAPHNPKEMWCPYLSVPVFLWLWCPPRVRVSLFRLLWKKCFLKSRVSSNIPLAVICHRCHTVSISVSKTAEGILNLMTIMMRCHLRDNTILVHRPTADSVWPRVAHISNLIPYFRFCIYQTLVHFIWFRLYEQKPLNMYGQVLSASLTI